MAIDSKNSSPAPLFTHNFQIKQSQIKQSLGMLILDNGIQNNLVSHNLVQQLALPTTPHPTPYQLGWVQKEGPHVMVTKRCALTFSIDPFCDIVLCDVSPLDCANVLLGIHYQELSHVVYHAHNHQYHIQKDDCTYVLTSSSLKVTALISNQPHVRQINLNNSISLCLVLPLKPNIPSHALPSNMDTLLTSFEYVFVSPTGLPLVHSIEHSIDLIPGATFTNSPSYCLDPQEAEEVECRLQQLLNTDHIKPIFSSCLVMDYWALNKATVKNHYPLPCIDDLLDHFKGACFFTKMDLTTRYH
jgi:hypothetical protein